MSADFLKASGKTAIQEFTGSLTPKQIDLLRRDWLFWARDNQLPPHDDWDQFVLFAGRGFGKTRAGAEFTKLMIEAGLWKRIALVGRTVADVRDVMVEGESGILGLYDEDDPARPLYEPSLRKLTWPNGAQAVTFSADKPDQLRGWQSDGAWCDELAAWVRAKDAWDNLQFGMRLGDRPRTVVTTTPRGKGNTQSGGLLLRMILKLPTTVYQTGSTHDNAENLPDSFIENIIKPYEGTTLGRQEIGGELIEDNPAALWSRALIEELRRPRPEHLMRIMVGVDPQGTTKDAESATGIIVVGKGYDGHGYVLGDYTISDKPLGWASAVARAFHANLADRIIAERNFGGDMVESNLLMADPSLPIDMVTASRGKAVRADPIANMYQQGKFHHCIPMPDLEDELCMWMPGENSPHRMDALVWAAWALFVDNVGANDGPATGKPWQQREIYGKSMRGYRPY